MEGMSFDRITRAFAARRTRRGAVRAAGAGAAIAVAGGPGRTLAQSAADASVCIVEIEIAVRLGPSFDDAGEDVVLTGEMRLPFGDRGRIDDGTVVFDDDDEEYAVVGQANGRAIDLVIDYGRRDRIVLVGVAEDLVSECRGEAGGPATGPERGDLGDWRYLALERIDGAEATATPAPGGSGGGGGSTGGGGVDPTPTPDVCAEEACASPLQWDPNACACNCAFTGYEATPCLGECCYGAFFCLDTGCGCPQGYESCADRCIESCGAGYTFDANACECFAD